MAVLKPSELSPTCAALMATLVPKYLDPDAYTVVQGGPDVATRLLELRWDHIFFTGGGRVGRLRASIGERRTRRKRRSGRGSECGGARRGGSREAVVGYER